MFNGLRCPVILDGKERPVTALQPLVGVGALSSPAEVSARKAEAKKKANALRNAGAHNANDEVAYVDFSHDQVARGKVRYGS